MGLNKYSKFKYIDKDHVYENGVRSIYKVAINDAYVIQFSKTKTGTCVDGKELILDHMWIRTRSQSGNDITWAEKQRLKNEFFPDCWATEAFPSKSDLMDQAPMYHLYVYPENFSLAYGLHAFDKEIDRPE